MSTTESATGRAPSRHDISAHAFWQGPRARRDEVFAELRAHEPVSWQRRTGPDGAAAGGFWAVTRHADIQHVSRHPELFGSGRGIMIDDVPPESLETSMSFISMDGARHDRARALVSAAFTPRQVKRIAQQITDRAATIVDELAQGPDECDFVAAVARRLPMWTISEMMGIPAERRQAVVDAGDTLVGVVGGEPPEGVDPVAAYGTAMTALLGLAHETIAERRAAPSDDLLSALMAADVDGERLSDQEIAATFMLFAIAGNDTTRNTTSHGMLALTEHPDQRAALLGDLDGRLGRAIEEMVRWASPVIHFRRTALADTELAGQRIRAGERVVVYYGSGNRDERAFTDPHRFDIGRAKNPHIGFGGGGVHFCLGASLARTQLRALFGELLRRYPQIAVTDPVYGRGDFVDGVRSARCTLGPAAG